MGKNKPQLDVVVIGCGLSGITMAIEIKKRLGPQVPIRIFERSDRPGGTWRDNIYPACGCDVPSHWYSLSSEPNPNWPFKFSYQEQILDYWDGIYQKYSLDRIVTFNMSFVEATWSASSCRWTVTLQPIIPSSSLDTPSVTGKPITITCTHLISTVGGFSTPIDSPPGLVGLKDFKGEKFHSAKWRYDIDLKGKRVGVVGNGCSAAQLVPPLVDGTAKGGGVGDDGKVIHFMRTPNWFIPRDQHPYSPLTKWVFAYVPGVMKLYRTLIVVQSEALWPMFLMKNKSLRESREKLFTEYLTAVAPKKYHEALIPKYPAGCKRIIFNPGYLECLHRANIDLISDPIDRVTEKGILCKSGVEHELDVLVLATGFDMSERGFGLNVTGTDGENLTERWISQAGPQAYLGTTVAGFPNFYMVAGPNVFTGHSSVLASTESQVNYIIKMLEPSVKYGVEALELRQEAEEEYNIELRGRLDETVWRSGCPTWYNFGDKTVSTWPGMAFSFWWRTRTPIFQDYRQIGGQVNLISKMRRKRLLQFVLMILFPTMGVVGWGLQRWFSPQLKGFPLFELFTLE